MIEKTPRMTDIVHVKHSDIKSTGNFILQIYDEANVLIGGHAVGIHPHRTVWLVLIISDRGNEQFVFYM